MKRIILPVLLMFIFACNNVNVFGQQKEYAHWSLNLKGGLNRAEFSGSGILADNAKYGLIAGLEIERTFNPLWGIALEGEYIDYSNFDLDASTFEVDLLGTVNLSNLLVKYRRGNWQRLNFYGRMGVGLSFYKVDENDGRTTIVIPMGLAMEYNLSKHFAIGLIGERRWHTSTTMGFENVTGRTSIWGAMANIRVKFGSKDHVRNTKLADYEEPFLASRYDDAPIKKAIADNENAVNQLKDQLNKANGDINKLNNDLNKANTDLNKTKEELAKCCKERPAAQATTASVTKSEFNNVEFDFNEAALKSSFKSELDKLVAKMQEQPNLNLQLVGHTDNSGGEMINQELSINRAQTIANYLIQKEIDSNRIEIKGMGYSQPITDNSTAKGRQQNRRVEIFWVNK